MIRVLFFGDSITAGTRKAEDRTDLGNGYPKYVSQALREKYPETQFDFFNCGIWGNETKDAVSRLQTDVYALEPNVVVLFLGVNDTLHYAENGALPSSRFKEQYTQILKGIKENTAAKILVIEPYLLMKDKYDRARLRWDLIEKIEIIRKASVGFADGYMPLDGLFASLYVTEGAESYTADGLHPNDKGARFIGAYCTQYLIPIIEKILLAERIF